MTRSRIALALVVCAALIAYLSFVPFRYQPIEFEQALARFTQIPYLNLGAGSRADWVANILMFLPLGWLAAAFFVPNPRGGLALLAVVPSLLLGAAWAIVVEFGQLHFPGRTVSINDIVAEVIGTFIGACLWGFFGASGRDWWRTFQRGGSGTVNAALGAYLLAYLVLSFSPFDFVISADELAQKAASNLSGWWLAPVSCGRTPCSLKLLVETLAVLPVGWWLAMRQPAGAGRMVAAAALGAALGALIELAQFLLVSGTSQGASVLARALGVAVGAGLHSTRHRLGKLDWASLGRPLVLAALLPWLAAVAFVSGWFGGRRLGLGQGLARLDQVEWMPFYYQYFSTEQALIRSSLVHLALYAFVGVAVWLWSRRSSAASAWVAAALAAAVAIAAETSKLFLRGKHPDYTDVFLAVAAAWTTATLLRRACVAIPGSAAPAQDERAPAGGAMAAVRARDVASAEAPIAATRKVLPVAAQLARDSAALQAAALLDGAGRRPVSMQEEPQRPVPPSTAGPPASEEEAAPPAVAAARSTASRTAQAVGAALLSVAALSLVRFPLWQVLLAVGLGVYAWLLWRRPLAYLLALPVALPLLDLAPLSGRFFWDEFDLLLATTLGVRLLAAQPAAVATRQLPRVALWLLALSVLASAAIALWPPPPLDANAFAGYLSPYNALRVARGYAWGGALLWLLWRDAAAGRDVTSTLLLGLGLGLLAAIAGVLWERLLFIGLDAPGADFRAAGLVSATHVGGAYLEAILVVLTPVALALGVSAANVRRSAFWFGVTLLSAAAVLMTLSRAAAAAWLAGVAAFALLWWLGARRPTKAGVSRRWRIGAVAVVLGLAAGGALMAQSDALRGRLALAGSDLGLRLAHWRAVMDLVHDEPLHLAFGMGLGSFPREFYVAQGAALKLPAYRLEREAGGRRTYLSLAGGGGMYVDQRVPVASGRDVLLRGQVRSSHDRARLAIALCEKSFLFSARCEWARVEASAAWRPFEVRLQLPESRTTRVGPSAPVSLSLANEAFGSRVDVTGLSLLNGSDELLANGSFGDGLDRWLMFSDVHLAWRALNTPLQIVFEQGLFGALAWLVLIVAIFAAVARRMGELPATGAAAAGVALLVVGAFDSVLDAPRLVALLTLLLWLATCARPQEARGATALLAGAATPGQRAVLPPPARG